MGAWGTGSFENDTALDWVWELEASTDLSVLIKAIDSVFAEEYIDSDVGTEALAALEVIARLRGTQAGDLPDEAEAWVQSREGISIPESLISRAREAVDAILGSDSELNELWEESDSYEEWKSDVEALRSRLSS